MKSAKLDDQISFSKKEAIKLQILNDERIITKRLWSNYYTATENLDRRSAFLKVATNKRRNK